MVQKFPGSNPGVSAGDWKVVSVSLAVNGYLFPNRGRIKQPEERDGLHLS